MGVAVLAIVTWSYTEKPHCFFYVSKCKKKGSAYSMAIAQDFLNSRVNLKHSQEMVWWSDGGKHFRSNMGLSTLGIRSLEALPDKSHVVKGDPRLLPSSSVQFGVAKHFKNICDTLFSFFNQCVTELAKSIELTDAHAMLTHMSCLWEQHRQTAIAEGREPRTPATFIDFFPQQEKNKFEDEYCIQLQKHCFREAIGVCHSWVFRLNDCRRRANLKSHDGTKFTAIDMKARMVMNHRADGEHTSTPELVEAGAESEEDDHEGLVPAEHEAEEMAAEALEALGPAALEVAGNVLGVKEHMGWKIYYRTSEPEKRDSKTWSKRINRMRERHGGVELAVQQRQKSVEQQADLQRRWKQRRMKQ